MTLVPRDTHGFAIVEVGSCYHVAQISKDGRLVSSAARSDMPGKTNGISAADFNEADGKFVSRDRTRGGANAAHRRIPKDKEQGLGVRSVGSNADCRR